MPQSENRNEIRQIKALPKDVSAEKNLIGLLMSDGTLLSNISEEIGPLLPKEFSSKKNRVIYEAILERSIFSDEFSPTLICAELEKTGKLGDAGDRAYVTSLINEIDVPPSAIVDLANSIRNTFRRRNIINVSEQAIDIACDPDGRTVDEIFDEASNLLYALSEQNAHQDNGPEDMVSVTSGLLRKIKEELDYGNGMQGVSTGFFKLDSLTSGLRGGTLNIIAARPGMGKTSFAMNIVQHIAMNPEVMKPALVFSLEMPSDQIALRMLSTFGRVPMRDILAWNVSDPQLSDIMQKLSLLTYEDSDGNKRNKLYIDDTADITPLELRSRARKLHEENGGLSVIMVDYVQLMKSHHRIDNRSQEVGEISRSLKLLSKELNVPVIALAQLNREVVSRKDQRPMNSDLRESGSLEQDADLIMFIQRDGLEDGKGKKDSEGGGPEIDSGDDTKALLIVGKNRNGPIGDIDLVFQGAYTAFYDAEDPNAREEIPFA